VSAEVRVRRSLLWNCKFLKRLFVKHFEISSNQKIVASFRGTLEFLFEKGVFLCDI